MSAPVATVFLGSGRFAVPALERLATLPEVRLRAVVTAPPRPAGRGRRERSSPVARWAAVAGVPALVPERLRAAGSVDVLRDLAPALLVLADYGQIVPPVILDLPRHGALNLHPSLLPRHRGATPVPAAILAGDAETGVSLMRMDAGLDTGPLIAQRRTPLGPEESAPDLEARLATLAAAMLAEELPGWLAGRTPALAQSEAGATYTRPLQRADGRLDPFVAAHLLERQIRAFRPWPGSYLETAMGRLIVHRATVLPAPPDEDADHAVALTGRPGAVPGRLIVTTGRGLALTTADGVLGLLEVQLAGGERMSGPELLRGRPALAGSLAASA